MNITEKAESDHTVSEREKLLPLGGGGGFSMWRQIRFVELDEEHTALWTIYNTVYFCIATLKY